MTLRQFPAEYDVAYAHHVKKELRKSLGRVRAAQSQKSRDDSASIIADTFLREQLLDGCKTIALYAAMEGKGELNLDTLEAHAAAAGIITLYPRLADDGSMEFCAASRSILEEQGRGFAEPPSHLQAVAPSSIDLLVVPGLAFDPHGHRIGFGRGFYDRFLPQCVRAKKVGVCFQLQVIAEVPVTPGDVALDMVVTERQIYRCGHGA